MLQVECYPWVCSVPANDDHQANTAVLHLGMGALPDTRLSVLSGLHGPGSNAALNNIGMSGS